jgi:hypothetical protein
MPSTQAWKDAVHNTARGTPLAAYTGHASLGRTIPNFVAGTVTEPAYAGFARQPVTMGAPSTPAGTTRRSANTGEVLFPAKVSPAADEEVGYALFWSALTGGVLYDANPLPETGATLTVTAATNAGPIVLTIGTHSLANGMFVRVAGVGGNTAANGDWQITVVNATQISLNGSTGNGAYTSGGTVRRFGFTITDGAIPRIAIGALFRDMAD